MAAERLNRACAHNFMNQLHDQKGDLKWYLQWLNLAREYPFSVLKHLQLFFGKKHKIYDGEEYFSAVMKFLALTPPHSFEFYKKELLADELLRRNYEQAFREGKILKKFKTYEDRCGNIAHIVNFYALIRIVKPNIVVETGTAKGSMTCWLLSALEKNGSGKLISIDLPAEKGKLTMDTTIEEKNIGILIPHEYHHRWNYIRGDAKLHLPKVFAEHDVDVFIHDSLHTRTHMLFEYHVARALMRPGSIIMTDDILWNDAWFSFVSSHKLRSIGCITNPNLALTVNEFDDFEKEIGVSIVR